MEFRTTFNIAASPLRITYYDPVMFIGSCFASSIGNQFEAGHMPVIINPTGTVYNPVSIINTIDFVTGRADFKLNDLQNYNGKWFSFDHYTDFSSTDCNELLVRINRTKKHNAKFLKSAKYLFITFGTARVYRFLETGKIVSNCHKVPASRFSDELLTVEEIVTLWSNKLDWLETHCTELKVIFSISPVRHLKDGAHGNQVSKSILFLAVEELLKHHSAPGYFPAYELLMDDLRDYRFYDDDMLHPSASAIEYIWNAFTNCYFDKETIGLWKEVSGIRKAVLHRIRSQSDAEIKEFAENIISRIDLIVKKAPNIDLKSERNYFLELL
ncbi:MAG: GSCFA domain-containing protein [Bacteroidales bacterium]